MPEKTDSESIGAALQIVKAVCDVVRAAGRMPSGHIYARLCGSMSLNAYEKLESLLIRTGLVRKSGDCLVWVEPAPV